MGIRVFDVDLRVLNMRTRMPFRYGIAELRELPHLIVEVTCEIDGKTAIGMSADGLAPKWFTKNPASSVADDLREMINVISTAAGLAREIGAQANVFEWWYALYRAQGDTIPSHIPPLLKNFGVSLIERAVIDAYCRRHETTFGQAIRANAFEIDLGKLDSSLKGAVPSDLLPPEPIQMASVRHTVGLSDPLRESDIAPDERLADGLPQSLDASIRAYGLTYFKIKLGGDVEKDRTRLLDTQEVVESSLNGQPYHFTLDGNEQYTSATQFRDAWNLFRNAPELQSFFQRLIFVEQPIHRQSALNDETQAEFQSWSDRPKMIIDESDGELGCLQRALECGYIGTSHKNCKGVIKGILNACMIESLRRSHPSHSFELSCEDLSNVGPIALTQDLAVCASLGIKHIERNGHHYFAGLSMWPADVQAAVLSAHHDLYETSPSGFPRVRIRCGAIGLSTVTRAPFGVGIKLSTRKLMAVNDL